MIEITARTQGGLRVEATDGRLTAVMDEPVEKGGSEAGLTPMQTLVASLAGCTAVTLKMYAGRKDYPLEDVQVRVEFEPGEKGAPSRFVQHVTLLGDLDQEQRERLMQIAGRCPVHRLLEAENLFQEVEVDAAGAT